MRKRFVRFDGALTQSRVGRWLAPAVLVPAVLVTGVVAAGLWLDPGPAEAAGAAPEGRVAQDPQVLELFERALPWYPDSTLRVVQDEVHGAGGGTYRVVTVERSCDERFLAGRQSALIDQKTSWACLGNVSRIPVKDEVSQGLRSSIEKTLPVALESALRTKVRVEWGDAYAPEGAVLPMTLQVSSGYGEFRRSAAVSADGKFLAMGEPLPFGKDPVAYRREMLRSSNLVIWDHGPADAAVEIVEFSDFECPGCKVKWALLETALERYGPSIHHGMVAFPLTSVHPWAFRAACAGWCVGQQSSDAVLPMKQLFYSLQSEMTVSQVTPTASDFVEGQGLSTESFKECYLRPPSLNAVHDQMSLGRTLGVDATPTYFINGWKVQVPEKTWLLPMIERLISEAAK